MTDIRTRKGSIRENHYLRFQRPELFHQMLMEDFDFLEAARLNDGNYDPPTLNYRDITNPDEFRDVALAYPYGLIQYDHFTYREPERVFNKRLKIEPDIRSLRFPARRSRWPPVGIWAHWLLNTTFFSVFMVIIIVTNAFTITLDQELKSGDGTENSDFRTVLETLDFFFLLAFVTEILLKWIDDFGHFWNHGWNIFEFIITLTSMAAPIIDLLFPDGDSEEEELEAIFNAVKYLRIIRIFRSLNVVTRIRKIQQIWTAVVKTFTAMIFITILMAIFFYMYAIVGIQIFRRYSASHKHYVKYRTAFRSLPMAFVTLFQVFTLDHWFELLEEIGEVTEHWAIALAFIISWICLGSFIFRNIFVGVMVNNFQNIRETMLAEEGHDENQKKLAHKLNIMTLDELEREHASADDPTVDWEAEIYHNLEVIKTLEEKMSPIMWPRDTMFQYLMLLEAYSGNMDERNHILKLLDKALLRFLDS